MENTSNTTGDGKGLGIAGLIVGIIAVLFSFIPCLGAWAIVPAIVGIILSAISMKQAGKAGAPKGMAIAGLVCSVVAAAIALYWIYAMMFAATALSEAAKEIKESGALDSLNKAMEQLKDVIDTANGGH